MKKLINDVELVVDELLEGFVAAHPGQVKRLPGTTVLVRADAPVAGKVGLVSGGGSGHEPAHGGFVGPGLLDAAVAGAVFTSPSPDQVYEAIKAVDGGKGVLLIIKNYTGDVMNFEMAAELAAADGIEVAQVVVNDDVAVEDSLYTTGRRGIAGTIFVHKLAGAMAATGADLNAVKAVAEEAIANLRSMGMALSPCTVPAHGKPTFELADNEMEIGMGIHGEPGIERVPLQSAKQVATTLTTKVISDLNLAPGEEVAVLINGLGSTPLMELYILNKTVSSLLAEAGLKVYKTFVGEYMTSLEMGGASVTLLRLSSRLKELLDAPAAAPGW